MSLIGWRCISSVSTATAVAEVVADFYNVTKWEDFREDIRLGEQ